MKQVGSNLKRHSFNRPATWLLGFVVVASAAMLANYAVRADDAGAGPMGAARLAVVEGQVRLTDGGQVIADSAPVNAPIFAGTRVETGDDGKAEIQFDDGSIARVSPNSALLIQSVGGDRTNGTDLMLDSGLAYFELPGDEQSGATRVVFGNSMVTVSGFTVLRVRMDQPPGDLAVFSGNAHLERGSISVDLRGGESITLDPNDVSRYNLTDNIEADSWDQWNTDRDQALSANASDQTAASSSYVNSDNPNPEWSDLDANGNWYNVPGQGYVWSPFIATSVSWDPYGCGHWMWTPRFGYVWVSCESWGYLPYSCGSWNYYNDFGWGWSPGMGRCMPWWRRGGYAGWNIGRGPSWYHKVDRPVLDHPRGRNPIPVINVVRPPQGGPNSLPQRGRNNPVLISGQRVEPERRLPRQDSYVRSTSGFVYHPTNNYQNRRDGSQVQNDRPGNDANRRAYEHQRVGGDYVRQANPGGPANTYRPPQGNNNDHGVDNRNGADRGGDRNPGDRNGDRGGDRNGGDRNNGYRNDNGGGNNTPPVITTQPGRIFIPQPGPQPPQNRGDENRGGRNRDYTPPPQPQPQPQPRTEPSRQYTPPPPQPQPQPRSEPSRPYNPPPSQHNPGGNGGGGGFARPAAPASPPPSNNGGPPPNAGGGPHGGAIGGPNHR
jgi:uncharacterized protein DUF6600/FecR-like protein